MPNGARVEPLPESRPTLENWLEPPGNRWAFRHVRELVPTARIAGQPASGADVTGADALVTPAVSDYLDRSFADALVVLHRGRTALEWYSPSIRPDDRHLLFSVTKSVTALVALALIAEGELDPHALVKVYVRESAASGFGNARVRDLLDMTANIAFKEDYSGADVRRYREAAGLLPAGEGSGLHAFLLELQAAGPHGVSFNYISPSVDMLGWVCERVGRATLAELISEYVWSRIGAEFEADLTLDRYGAARAAGGLCATARDMAQIGQHVLDGGTLAAPDPWVADLLQPGDTTRWAAGDSAQYLPGGAYRACWYQSAEDGVLLAGGIHGQTIYVDLPRRIVIAQQSSMPEANDEAIWHEMIEVFRDLARRLGEPAPY
jgi:CubicO group peptidase (beta-lactamase class C family)